MDKEQLIRRLMVTFLAEFEEHVRALDRDLLELERRPDGQGELLETLFRTVHSLKGAARSVNVGLVEAVCHRLETRLSAARSSRTSFEPDVIELLFACADGLRDASERLAAQRDLSAGPLPALLLRLDGGGEEQRVRPAVRWRAADGFVRVPAEKLDTLLARSGELLVARRRAASRHEDVRALVDLLNRVESQAGSETDAGFSQLARGLEVLAAGMELDQHLLDQAATALEDDVKRVRMLPFRDACEGLDRVVRDLGHDGNKRVELGVEGGMVELDRSILGGLADPLLHLVRNAVVHGLEPQHQRQARGKPATGRVTVSASLRGVGVEIVVADDGRGLDLAKIREQAVRRGLPVPMDGGDLGRLVFLPGFSTAEFITELSGRGVGLDVVKHQVESLHGTVDVESTPEVGTRFVMTLPLTLTTLRALLVESSHQVFALPSASIQRLVRVAASDLRSVEGRDVWLGGGSPVAVASLARILGLDTPSIPPGAAIFLVVIAVAGKRIALAVDDFLAEQDCVVKSLGPRLRHVLHFSGATLLPTGRIALILNAADLLATGLAARPLSLATLDEVAPIARRLLVVDDSVTTRTLEKSILESAGFDVVVAADGAQAWQLLQTLHVDLVVADVEMPRMDGVALTVAIRGSKRFRELPVILVTALETDVDKARGLEAGADAYLPKSTFDQSVLLQTIAQLL